MIAMAPKRAGGKWDQLAYIDPLCGPGLDIARNGDEFPGSPLIGLNADPAFDRLYLGDLDPENVEALQARLTPSALGRVSLEPEDCHARAHSIVQSLGGRTLGLAFIDPEGFEVDWRMFQTLSQRAIDIVYLFPSGIGIVRNLTRFVSERHSDLDRLWGSRDWRSLPGAQAAAGVSPTAVPGDAVYHSWADAFCRRVASLGYAYYDIKGPLRGDTRVPMYHLLFFSKSTAGLTIWRKVHKIEPGGQRNFLSDL